MIRHIASRLAEEVLAQADRGPSPSADDGRARELEIALAEYSRRSSQVAQSTAAVDQALSLLGVGLSVLFAAGATAFTEMWDGERWRFWLVSGILCAIAAILTSATFFRLVRSRLLQTTAERAQSRIRHLLVELAPNVHTSIGDTIHDDWPTPYTNPFRSGAFALWTGLAAAAAASAGAAIGLLWAAGGQRSLGSTMIVTGAAAGVAFTGLTSWLWRHLRARRRADVAVFPRRP